MALHLRGRDVLVVAAVAAAAATHLHLAAPALAARAATLRPALVFVSTRDHPSGSLNDASEIYLMDGDWTNVRRLTDDAFGDGLPAISPDGMRIVFDSNRKRLAGQPLNTQHLFLMNVDGSGLTPLTWGSSATWSPDGASIAFHASAGGGAPPIRIEPGAPAPDSDIFVMDVGGFLTNGTKPRNLTNTPGSIEDDADWSPDGRAIAFTRRTATGRGSNGSNDPSTELFAMTPDGGPAVRLTTNTEEERAPAWSPDGKRLAFMARRGGTDFEICVMNADGTGSRQLTDNTTGDLTPSWSLDGTQIAFHRIMGPGRYQLFTIGADGTGEVQLTDTPGLNGFPKWGRVLDPRGKVEK
jgi:Tol biopolymer transport system component